jgi:hypothetical protein
MRRADIMYEGITARGGDWPRGGVVAAGPAGRSVLPDLDISIWCCIALRFEAFLEIFAILKNWGALENSD